MKVNGSNLRDRIGHDEEYFLQFVTDHQLPCPELSRIWESFYDGPRIYPNQSRSITAEIGIVDSAIRSHLPATKLRSWESTRDRLILFFHESEKQDGVIQCVSD